MNEAIGVLMYGRKTVPGAPAIRRVNFPHCTGAWSQAGLHTHVGSGKRGLQYRWCQRRDRSGYGPTAMPMDSRMVHMAYIPAQNPNLLEHIRANEDIIVLLIGRLETKPLPIVEDLFQ